jgi:short-subunit dehydrogenase
VINVASLLALSGLMPPGPLPHRAVYAAAKAFTVAFTQAVAGELAGTGVRVQACLPGLVATEFHSVQGMDLSKIPRMTAADVVTASLAALAQGEVTCVPGLDDPSLLERLAEAQRAVVMSANRPTLAHRYEATG